MGTSSPLVRPCGGVFESWLAAHAVTEPTREIVDDGISRLTVEDGDAVIDAYASRYPDLWRDLVDDVGGLDTAEPAAIVGAFAAALRESRKPPSEHLALIANDHDPAEALAFALDGTNLWSIAEATLLDDALGALDSDLDDDAYAILWEAAVEEVAQMFWSEAHARRLDVLVQRLRTLLPTLKPRAAVSVLADACDAFAEDEGVRGRLAALLLSDTLGPLLRMSRAAAA